MVFSKYLCIKTAKLGLLSFIFWLLSLDTPDTLLLQIPRDEEGEPLYDEYICQECSVTCSFLNLYPASIWATLKPKNVSATSVKEENGLENGNPPCPHPGKNENGISVSEKVMNGSSSHSESESLPNEKDSLHGENTEKTLGLAKPEAQDKDSSLKCVLEVNINTMSLDSGMKRPMFLSKTWRDLLCRCKTCCEFYSAKGIDYLVDNEDSLQEYEKIAQEKRKEKLQQQEGAAMKFIDTLGHVQKIEILNGIADMKNELQTFLVCSLSICNFLAALIMFVLFSSLIHSSPMNASLLKGNPAQVNVCSLC